MFSSSISSSNFDEVTDLSRSLRYRIQELRPIYESLHGWRGGEHTQMLKILETLVDKIQPMNISFADDNHVKFIQQLEHLEKLFNNEKNQWQIKHPNADFITWMNLKTHKDHALRLLALTLQDIYYNNATTQQVLVENNYVIKPELVLVKQVKTHPKYLFSTLIPRANVMPEVIPAPVLEEEKTPVVQPALPIQQIQNLNLLQLLEHMDYLPGNERLDFCKALGAKKLQTIAPELKDIFAIALHLPVDPSAASLRGEDSKRLAFLVFYFESLEPKDFKRLIDELHQLSDDEKLAYTEENFCYYYIENISHPTRLLRYRIEEMYEAYNSLYFFHTEKNGNWGPFAALRSRSEVFKAFKQNASELLNINFEHNALSRPAQNNENFIQQLTMLEDGYNVAREKWNKNNIENSSDETFIKKMNECRDFADHRLRIIMVSIADTYRACHALLVKLNHPMSLANIVFDIEDPYDDKFTTMRKSIIANVKELSDYFKSVKPGNKIQKCHTLGAANIRALIKTFEDLIDLLSWSAFRGQGLVQQVELQMFLEEVLGLDFLKQLVNTDDKLRDFQGVLPTEEMREYFSKALDIAAPESSMPSVAHNRNSFVYQEQPKPNNNIKEIEMTEMNLRIM